MREKKFLKFSFIPLHIFIGLQYALYSCLSMVV